MKVGLCITTINKPTLGIRVAAKEVLDASGSVHIAGDSKTDHEAYKGLGGEVRYIEPKGKHDFWNELPLKSYGRKNLAYLDAIKSGCSHILETDDDNIPYSGWVRTMFEESMSASEVAGSDKLTFNPYQLFTDERVWPRGLLLDQIDEPTKHWFSSDIRPGILQSLADKSPDVDAIWRLSNTGDVWFRARPSFAVAHSNLVPTNSQNTLWIKQLFPLLYIPMTVEMRFCDILRGYVASRLCNLHGYDVVFCRPTVYQERNYHNIYADFVDEFSMYRKVPQLLDSLMQFETTGDLRLDLVAVYDELISQQICQPGEKELLNFWLSHV